MSPANISRRKVLAGGVAFLCTGLGGGKAAARGGHAHVSRDSSRARDTARVSRDGKAPDPAAVAIAVAYAKAQIGKPYLWGGTGPAAYDCSGLTQMAYRAAGITIPRRSQEQWTQLPHVAVPQRGDLVFFPGADGTWAEPGHVALVLNPRTRQMIEAYETGFPIRIRHYDTGDALPGDSTVVGFARPSAR